MSQSINLYNQLANHKLFNKSVNFGLKRIKLALRLLEHPEKKLKNVISVIGESGKFTTLFSLKSFIEANNQKVTTHVSPSIRDIKERFFMGDQYLNHQEIKKGHEDFVFLNNRGAKLTRVMIFLIIQKLAEEIGLKKKISPHTFRHSFATHMLNRGAGIETLKDLLGHANLSATQIYTHNSFAQLNNIYKQSHPRG